MEETKIKLVVFDIAGTTLYDENYVHQSLIKAMSSFGYSISTEEANNVMGYPKPYAIKELLKIKENNSEKITEKLIDKIHSVFVQDMKAFYKTNSQVKPVMQAEETFILLKKMGIKIALDTGFSKEITDVIIERLQWKKNGLIDAYISSDEVEAGRPYPYMIHTLMSLFNISSAEEVAKVGDTISDLQEGNNAACKYVIGVTTGAYSKAQLQNHKHTHLIDNLLDVIHIVTH
jgi:phosphonatase-like hydrolase